VCSTNYNFSYSAPLSTILLLPPFSAQISSLAPLLEHPHLTFFPKYHEVSQPSDTAGRIIVLCPLTVVFMDSKQEEKRF